ncbi:hypothetical protein ACFZCL_09370 [Streptomyces sp. NPDC008159]|uniref:hypothetical protein n=1 Tax=Streptomyces sp. NPDC008159 TaxID=3364817 RepID=UPI0036F10E50
MNAVVYRGARTHEIEIRVAEAPAPAKEEGGRGVRTVAPVRIATGDTEALCADPPRERAIPGGSRADDLAGATVFPASPASDRVNGIAPPVDGGWPGR